MRQAKKGLVRLVLIGSQLQVDENSKLPGRGVYLHRSADCFESAVAKSAFNRSFRTKVDVSHVQDFFRP